MELTQEQLREKSMIMEKNTTLLSTELKKDLVDLDRIEIDVGADKIEEGITIYKDKLIKPNDVFERMFLDNCILDLYKGKKLVSRVMFNKKETGMLFVAYMFDINAGVTGIYCFDDFSLNMYPSQEALAKVKKLASDRNSTFSGYNPTTKTYQTINEINSEAFLYNMMLEILGIFGYVNGLATSDKEIVEQKIVYREQGANSKKKKKSKGSKKAKIKLVKKFIVKSNKVTSDDNKILEKRGYIKYKGSWNVGGHWRTYRHKDGSIKKKIWIAEYEKGEGRKKVKTYIV